MDELTLRAAGSADGYALERVAQLDSRQLPPGPHLVAVREGRIDAAISLSTGEVIADPFRPTAELCALLRCHVRSLPAAGSWPPARRARPRPAVATT